MFCIACDENVRKTWRGLCDKCISKEKNLLPKEVRDWAYDPYNHEPRTALFHVTESIDYEYSDDYYVFHENKLSKQLDLEYKIDGRNVIVSGPDVEKCTIKKFEGVFESLNCFDLSKFNDILEKKMDEERLFTASH